MAEQQELKPCPHCGGADIRFDSHPNDEGYNSHLRAEHGDTVWSMCCRSCGATFPNRYRKQLLVDAWNRRPEAKQKTPIEARDEFLNHLIATLPPGQCGAIFHAADKLLTLVTQPNMLYAFTLANAELAALHYQDKLSVPEIVRVGMLK